MDAKWGFPESHYAPERVCNQRAHTLRDGHMMMPQLMMKQGVKGKPTSGLEMDAVGGCTVPCISNVHEPCEAPSREESFRRFR